MLAPRGFSITTVCESQCCSARRSRRYAVLRFSNTVLENTFSTRRSGTRIENRHGAHHLAELNELNVQKSRFLRATLGAVLTQARDVVAQLQRAGDDVAPVIRQATKAAVDDGVRQSLAGIREVATREITGSAASVGQAVGAGQAFLGQLKRALWLLSAVAVLWFMAMAAYSYGSLWWVRHQIDGLAQERAELVKQIGELKENAAELAQKGGKIKLLNCSGRLCIEASTNQGAGTTWKGGNWGAGGATMVVPKGY